MLSIHQVAVQVQFTEKNTGGKTGSFYNAVLEESTGGKKADQSEKAKNNNLISSNPRK